MVEVLLGTGSLGWGDLVAIAVAVAVRVAAQSVHNTVDRRAECTSPVLRGQRLLLPSGPVQLVASRAIGWSTVALRRREIANCAAALGWTSSRMMYGFSPGAIMPKVRARSATNCGVL